MNNYDTAGADALEYAKRKKARAALDGIIGLLYVAHSPAEVTDMLKDAYEEAASIG